MALFLAKVRDETVRIAVWGGGALGLLWSARLAPRTGPFLLVTRTASRPASKQYGNHLDNVVGRTEKNPVNGPAS